MELFIATQDMSILNMNKIQSIDLLSGVMENDDTHEKVDVIEIAATMEFGDEDEPIPLGFYLTEEQAISTMEQIIEWLSEKNEYKRVFSMPPIQKNDEVELNPELELDYSVDSEVSGDE